MKFSSLFLAIMFSAGLASAQIVTNSFTFNPNQTIPDASASGEAFSVNLNGMSGPIGNVSVNLNITGGFNGDLYAFLIDPSGSMAVLLNRPGMGAANPFGYSNAGFNITLNDAVGANSIHYYQNFSPTYSGGQLTGTWSADGINIDPQSSPGSFDGAAALAGLSLFNGSDANGNWTLFIADLSAGGQSTLVSAGGQSTLVSWGLQIVTVPEPQSWLLLASGFGVLAVLSHRRVTKNGHK